MLDYEFRGPPPHILKEAVENGRRANQQAMDYVTNAVKGDYDDANGKFQGPREFTESFLNGNSGESDLEKDVKDIELPNQSPESSKPLKFTYTPDFNIINNQNNDMPNYNQNNETKSDYESALESFINSSNSSDKKTAFWDTLKYSTTTKEAIKLRGNSQNTDERYDAFCKAVDLCKTKKELIGIRDDTWNIDGDERRRANRILREWPN